MCYFRILDGKGMGSPTFGEDMLSEFVMFEHPGFAGI